MNEIAQLLQQRFGMSKDQAQEAERAVLQLIQSKVPEQYRGVLNSLLGAGQAEGGESSEAATSSGGLGSLLGAAAGMFGGKES